MLSGFIQQTRWLSCHVCSSPNSVSSSLNLIVRCSFCYVNLSQMYESCQREFTYAHAEDWELMLEWLFGCVKYECMKSSFFFSFSLLFLWFTSKEGLLCVGKQLGWEQPRAARNIGSWNGRGDLTYETSVCVVKTLQHLECLLCWTWLDLGKLKDVTKAELNKKNFH